MNAKYAMKTTITSYDVGPTRTLKPSSLLKIIQEAAGRHLEQDGESYDCMRGQGIVFLLINESVKIKRMPNCREKITVETWFEGTEAAKFIRNMRFSDENGASLVEIASKWIIADPETHRVLRPTSLPFKMPQVSDDRVGAKVERLKFPAAAKDAGVRTVRFSDIDCNHHMNNAVYADIICDFFPGGLADKELCAFQIDFNGEAELDDKIKIKTAPDGCGAVLFEGKIGEKKCFTAKASARSLL